MAGTLENDAAFRDKLHELMDEYGIVDYAIAGRDLDGKSIAFWVAGTDKDDDSVSNYERISVLAMMLETLKMHCLTKAVMPARK
jgi:hypothetical protein